jgi:type VI secretion system secreted protein VgrG
VLVTFLGGDVDRPVVTGCVYNGIQPVPYTLPEKKTQSGIKTRSTPGGEGFNEILFDDEKGGELLSLRAQRDLVETVVKDRRSTVGGSTVTTIGADRKVEIQGADRLEVRGGLVTRVEGPSSAAVGGDSVSACAGNRQTEVAGNDVARIEGGHTVMAKMFSHTLIGHGADEGHGLVYVNGDYRISAAQVLELAASKGIKLVCGESTIELGPKEIRLTAPTLTLKAAAVSCATEDNALQMGETIQLKGKEVKLFSEDASVVLDKDAKIDGALVKLNCGKKRPPPKQDDLNPDEKGDIVFQVKSHVPDDGGEPPILVIATPEGKLIEKQADADGKVTLEGKKGDRFHLVDVRRGKQSLSKRPG